VRYAKVVENIASVRPKTPVDILVGCRYPLKYIGDGAYRTVYQVIGTNIIVKFSQSFEWCRDHALKEYETVTKLRDSKLKRHIAIKEHLPELYHYNHATGVTVGRYYKLLPEDAWAERSAVSSKILKACKTGFGDLENSGNIGKDEKGVLKILDAGCLSVL
jgi:hypothetical protein